MYRVKYGAKIRNNNDRKKDKYIFRYRSFSCFYTQVSYHTKKHLPMNDISAIFYPTLENRSVGNLLFNKKQV